MGLTGILRPGRLPRPRVPDASAELPWTGLPSAELSRASLPRTEPAGPRRPAVSRLRPGRLPRSGVPHVRSGRSGSARPARSRARTGTRARGRLTGAGRLPATRLPAARRLGGTGYVRRRPGGPVLSRLRPGGPPRAGVPHVRSGWPGSAWPARSRARLLPELPAGLSARHLLTGPVLASVARLAVRVGHRPAAGERRLTGLAGLTGLTGTRPSAELPGCVLPGSLWSWSLWSGSRLPARRVTRPVPGLSLTRGPLTGHSLAVRLRSGRPLLSRLRPPAEGCTLLGPGRRLRSRPAGSELPRRRLVRPVLPGTKRTAAELLAAELASTGARPGRHRTRRNGTGRPRPRRRHRPWRHGPRRTSEPGAGPLLPGLIPGRRR
jgi:hypothetical protein